MIPSHIVVEAVVPTAANDDNLRACAWDYLLDQRAFGPRRLLVAVAEPDGQMVGIAHTKRLEVPELALDPCLRHLERGTIAVAYCDELVADGTPPADLADRFALARKEAARSGVHLVDWFACDDQWIRSSRLALGATAEDWWDVPGVGT